MYFTSAFTFTKTQSVQLINEYQKSHWWVIIYFICNLKLEKRLLHPNHGADLSRTVPSSDNKIRHRPPPFNGEMRPNVVSGKWSNLEKSGLWRHEPTFYVSRVWKLWQPHTFRLIYIFNNILTTKDAWCIKKLRIQLM